MKSLLIIFVIVRSSALVRADKAPDCKGLYDQGAQRFEEKRLDDAAAVFAKGYAACGPGHGFLQAEGYVRATQGKIEDAAALYLREISEPSPTAAAFGNLERVRDKLSVKTKSKIVAMGATAAAPVHVLGIAGEYSWARAFTCLGAKKLDSKKQSTAKAAYGTMLDVLQFICPGDTVEHTVYFDYGTDPQEEEYKREREAIDAQPKPNGK